MFRQYLAGLIATAREFSAAVGALRQQLQALPARVVGADRRRLGRRQPHARVPQGRPRRRHPGGVPHPRHRREQLLRLRRHDRRRPVRHPPRARARRAVRRQRLRGRPTSSASRGTCPTRSRCGRRSDAARRVLRRRRAPPRADRWPRPSGRRSTARSPTGSCVATGSGSEPRATANSDQRREVVAAGVGPRRRRRSGRAPVDAHLGAVGGTRT